MPYATTALLFIISSTASSSTGYLDSENKPPQAHNRNEREDQDQGNDVPAKSRSTGTQFEVSGKKNKAVVHEKYNTGRAMYAPELTLSILQDLVLRDNDHGDYCGHEKPAQEE